MIKNLISYYNGEDEYSVNLHVIKTQRENKVMFITVTKVDNGMDYTVIFNGLPTVKDLQNACQRDEEAAKFIIKALKEEDVKEYAKEYWNFIEEGEWEDNLDNSLALYIEKCLKCL